MHVVKKALFWHQLDLVDIIGSASPDYKTLQ